MQQTTLKFPSIIELLDFELAVNLKVSYVNKTHLTITGDLGKEELDLALKQYNARIIDDIEP